MRELCQAALERPLKPSFSFGGRAKRKERNGGQQRPGFSLGSSVLVHALLPISAEQFGHFTTNRIEIDVSKRVRRACEAKRSDDIVQTQEGVKRKQACNACRGLFPFIELATATIEADLKQPQCIHSSRGTSRRKNRSGRGSNLSRTKKSVYWLSQSLYAPEPIEYQ